ncbi:MAG TPA: NAD(P)/FAD-dependent oxidoreductase [Flavihumibacter sp.]|nr:NAD(P)/FAD-dependent oxidoreductase [Flavihumibacter sp.]
MTVEQPFETDIAIAGGGLAGLSAAILLARQGHSVVLLEKNEYPFHRVCGEYISEESRPFLASLGLDLPATTYPLIRQLQLSAPAGLSLLTDLQPGGFGISRYRLDDLLAQQARAAGVRLLTGLKVDAIQYRNGKQEMQAGKLRFAAKLALGCFGKRSNLDLGFKRPFAIHKPGKAGNYIAVKYHVRYDQPIDTIALHNFDQGYCGISAVENNQYCLCYLTIADNLARCGNNIPQMEATILAQNPFLRNIWQTADFGDRKPISISQVSFAPKSTLENHVLMIGDAAGLITPLCGNGMSIAMHGAKLAAGLGDSFLRGKIFRSVLEAQYQRQWKQHFGRRLQAGRAIQYFFGNPRLSNWLLRAGRMSPALTRFLIKQTHGENF